MVNNNLYPVLSKLNLAIHTGILGTYLQLALEGVTFKNDNITLTNGQNYKSMLPNKIVVIDNFNGMVSAKLNISNEMISSKDGSIICNILSDKIYGYYRSKSNVSARLVYPNGEEYSISIRVHSN